MLNALWETKLREFSSKVSLVVIFFRVWIFGLLNLPLRVEKLFFG